MTVNHNPIVAIFTATRAEYGLLRHLAMKLDREPKIDLNLIVSGTHLSARHGFTVQEIINDNISVDFKIPLLIDSLPLPSMAQLCAETLVGASKCLLTSKPDMIIILGDRYESYAAATAAHLECIPIAHLHGGETTEGAIDNKLRHAITQLSTWHFTSHEHYRDKVIKMGQPETHVFNIGPMALDNIMGCRIISKDEFENLTKYRFTNRNLLVTYHSETLSPDKGIIGFKNLLEAIKQIDCNVLFTHPNIDKGGEEILKLMTSFVNDNCHRSWCIPSLGHELYINSLRLFDVMAGNSSSGLIEAAYFQVKVLNIGNRQSGRIPFGDVTNTSTDKEEILEKLNKVCLQNLHSTNQSTQNTMLASPSDFIVKWLKSEFQN
ncbi:UDP-N-acetylglucosamine 2-epimerase [Prochlorococcus sp. MIT 1306]|uniref:UDP-N-acetylglucosamine 2-epimerase n=1 Tax=Prochlorococcus sp. MIT 1306 TaxID=1799667 RepID=UPI0007B3C77E|nr:UDP-N-acetylglucosamine 2-epimerase [Prochlorococcus sp. MIT 1306]KZR61081.1 GDP/UDP-N,N'-diacetylbacillosamine 2-epimerase (hydrolyzing) [Prochlorococcus sp. MIT 1306]